MFPTTVKVALISFSSFDDRSISRNIVPLRVIRMSTLSAYTVNDAKPLNSSNGSEILTVKG